MRNTISLLSACLLLAACAPNGEQRKAAELHGGVPQPGTAALDTLLRTAVEQHRVPHVAAMIGTPDSVVYQFAAGVSKDTVFAIASMTKPITSVAVMQLVETGKIKLDEPASTYAPELAKVQVLEGGKLRPPKSPPTVRQLLSHTAGFGYEFMNTELRDYVAKGKLSSVQTGDDKFLQAPLVFDPGTRWEYGINTDWLGRIVEKVSGQTLEAYFRQNIFDPLSMPDSFFNVPQDKQPRMAHTYQRNADGTLAEQPVRPFKPMNFFSGGGGLYSTAADYMQFTRALLAGGSLGGKRILKPETVAMMAQNQIGDLTRRAVRSLLPQLLTDGGELAGGLDKFGLGFAVNSKPQDKGRGANSMAWAGIYNTFFWIDREKKTAAVLMTQMLPGLDKGPATLLADFDKAVYAWRD